METFLQTTGSTNGASRPARALLSLTAACLLLTFGAPNARAQESAAVRPRLAAAPAEQQQRAERPSESPFDDEDDEGEEENRALSADPATLLRTARVIRVRSDSVFVSEREVEDSLRKRKEFRAWGMVITRNDSEADLIIDITRKSLTRRFTFTVLDPKTMTVVTSGKTRSVLFGKKIPNKIAEKFTNRLRLVRPYPPLGP